MRRRGLAALGLVGVLALAACGGSGSSAPPTTVTTLPPPTTTTVPVTTSAMPRVITAAPTTAPPTTAAPVTTEAPTTTLPQPVAPPPADAVEDTSQIGSIQIPKIGVDISMFEGIALTTLDKGPGHWPGTAMPGQQGNVVIAGHRVSHSKPFRNIDKLQVGDQVLMTTGDQTFTYSVTGHDIVTPTTIQIIEQTAGYTATLFACHPPGSVQYRYVVHLALVDPPPPTV